MPRQCKNRSKKSENHGGLILTTGAQIFEVDKDLLRGRLAWDDFRIFLAVVEAGSIKAASKALSCSHNTVRAHIRRLEDLVGAPLLRRGSTGISLTAHGERLRETALDMKAASLGLSRTLRASESGPRTELHVAVTEGLGTFWMIPRFAPFYTENPDILLTLECTMDPEVAKEHRCDFAVQLSRPEDESLICSRIGTLHMMPFASKEYIKRNGTPRDIEEARNHQWVLQVADQVRTELLSAFAGDELPSRMLAMKTNSSSAHYWAIAKGAGMGVLPTYARAITGNVVPVDMGVRFRRDIWLVYRPEAKQTKAGASIISWIKDSFDNARYPWFSDKYLHPDHFEDEFSGTNVVRLFAGFMDIPA